MSDHQNGSEEEYYTIERATQEGYIYTREAGTEVLSKNAGRPVYPDYIRTLGRNGKIRKVRINPRLTLYHKGDVDAYVVEEPGVKAGRSATELAAARKKAGQRRKRSPNKKKGQ